MPMQIDRKRTQKTLVISRKLEQYFGRPTEPPRRVLPLDMLIATLLSQNTNDKNSHRAYQELRKTFPSWEQVLNARTKDIAAAIRVGGMANQKSVRIKDILGTVKAKFGALKLNVLRKKSTEEIFDLLCSFDGVGTKTAACVLLFSLGREVFPVDTHIHRICGRLGIAPSCKTPDQTFEWMKRLVPKGRSYSFHVNLIRFGRKICRATNPLCGKCPLYAHCVFDRKAIYRKLMSPIRLVDYEFMTLDHV